MAGKCSKHKLKRNCFGKETKRIGKQEHIFLKFKDVEFLVGGREKFSSDISESWFKFNNARDSKSLIVRVILKAVDGSVGAMEAFKATILE